MKADSKCRLYFPMFFLTVATILLQLGQLDLSVGQETVAKLSGSLVSEINCCATTLKKIILVCCSPSSCSMFPSFARIRIWIRSGSRSRSNELKVVLKKDKMKKFHV